MRRGSGTRCSCEVGSARPPTSSRTAWRVRVCIRTPPSAGSDSTALRRCGSARISRYRPSWSRSGSSVRPTTRSHSCWSAWSPSRPNAVSTSSQPMVNGSLTTSMSQPSRASQPGRSRLLIRRAIAVGLAGSATRPMWIGFISAKYPRWSQRNAGTGHGVLTPPARRYRCHRLDATFMPQMTASGYALVCSWHRSVDSEDCTGCLPRGASVVDHECLWGASAPPCRRTGLGVGIA